MELDKYTTHERILVAVDCIIFGFDGKSLQVLLIRRGMEPQKGNWSLMGGFVHGDESVEEAAARVLNQLTGLSGIYMEQLYCFGDVNRDSAGRVISVSYFALINIHAFSRELVGDYHAEWFPLDKLPPLIFDHRQMLDTALERLRQKVANHPIGFELLPTKFTLPQLQNLYEAIYGYPLDKRNFSRKILSLGILQKLNEKEKETSKKGAFYYIFDRDMYNKLAHEGLKFI